MMHIHIHVFSPSTLPLIKPCIQHNALSKALAFPALPFNSTAKKSSSCALFGPQRNLCTWPAKGRSAVVVSAVEEENFGTDIQRKRKVVEHICLLKAKEDFSEDQEKDMLDYLYTTQYQMGGIVAISLGRVSDQNPERYTHAIFMRFQTKEHLAKFYENPFYTGVLKEHVMPYCHEVVNFDFESEVDDDILPIFRKGEEYNYGVELLLLLSFTQGSLGGPAEDAMTSLSKLTLEFPSLIVQATEGKNMNASHMEYTHGIVIRFRSSEAFTMFMDSSEYSNIWEAKFKPILQKALSVYYSVDPVGTDLM